MNQEVPQVISIVPIMSNGSISLKKQVKRHIGPDKDKYYYLKTENEVILTNKESESCLPATNTSWVSVGTMHDTAQFAVATLRQWWYRMGMAMYPDAKELLITADGGGSNGVRCRLWKVELQKFANETCLRTTVCHFPPGTSKWNKIEHRMFCHITSNWHGRPLSSYEVIVNLIVNTTTSGGLIIEAKLDACDYPTGIRITDEQMKELNLRKHDFHGSDWNYTLDHTAE